MTKTIQLSQVAFNTFFKPLLEKYKWNVDVTDFSKTNTGNFLVKTEEPIFQEILAAMKTQIEYAQQIITSIETAK